MLTLHKMNKVAAATFLAVVGGASSMACATRLTRMFPAGKPITGLLHVTPSTGSAGEVDYGVLLYDAAGTIVNLPIHGSADDKQAIDAFLTAPMTTDTGSDQVWLAGIQALDGVSPQTTLGHLADIVDIELTAEQLVDGSTPVMGVFRFRGVIDEVAKSWAEGTTPGAPEKEAGRPRAPPQAADPVRRSLFE